MKQRPEIKVELPIPAIRIKEPTTTLESATIVSFIKLLEELAGEPMVHCPKCSPGGTIVVGSYDNVPCDNDPECPSLKMSQMMSEEDAQIDNSNQPREH